MIYKRANQIPAFVACAMMAGILCAKEPKPNLMTHPATKIETATFAGGCFWCMESPFDKAPGVASTVVGYTGGSKKNPTYEEVCAGGTGHAEAIQVRFDPSKISYEQILDIFWRQIDPLTPDAQFCDHGNQYRSAIFYHDEIQKKAALKSKENLEKSGPYAGKKIVTEITSAGEFWPAEEYHQDYYIKNPIRYKYYRYSCGRDQFLEKIWGKSKP